MWFFLWVGCFGVFFYVLLFDPFIERESDRDGIFPKNFIHLVYDQNLKPSVDFYIIVNTEKHEIVVDADIIVINQTKPSFIAVVLPFQGKLTESTNWYFKNFNENTVIVKEYCMTTSPCEYRNIDDGFKLTLDEKIDQKQSYHHTVRFKFLNSAPTEPEYGYIREFIKNSEPITLGFSNLDTSVSVLFDKTADNILVTPQAKPDSFSDKNLQRVWEIAEQTYQVDYQVPSERKAEKEHNEVVAISAAILTAAAIVPFAISTIRTKRKIPNIRKWS